MYYVMHSPMNFLFEFGEDRGGNGIDICVKACGK